MEKGQWQMGMREAGAAKPEYVVDSETAVLVRMCAEDG